MNIFNSWLKGTDEFKKDIDNNFCETIIQLKQKDLPPVDIARLNIYAAGTFEMVNSVDPLPFTCLEDIENFYSCIRGAILCLKINYNNIKRNGVNFTI